MQIQVIVVEEILAAALVARSGWTVDRGLDGVEDVTTLRQRTLSDHILSRHTRLLLNVIEVPFGVVKLAAGGLRVQEASLLPTHQSLVDAATIFALLRRP